CREYYRAESLSIGHVALSLQQNPPNTCCSIWPNTRSSYVRAQSNAFRNHARPQSRLFALQDRQRRPSLNSSRLCSDCQRMIGMETTRQRQSTVTLGAAAPLASQAKTAICTSVPLLISACVAVTKNGPVDWAVATTLIGSARERPYWEKHTKSLSKNTLVPSAPVNETPLTSS